MTRFSVISADSHIIEPPDLWTSYAEPAMRGRVPSIRRVGGKDTFYAGDYALGVIATSCRAGKPPSQTSDTVEDVYAGAYDPKVRVGEQLKDGIEAEVVYPTVALRTFSIPDRAVRHASIVAYNNWMADWCKVHPDRHKGIALVDVTDLEAGVAELRRTRSSGHVGAMITLAVDDPKLFWTNAYDRFWAEAQDLQVPISMHVVGQSAALPNLAEAMNETFIHTVALQSFASMIWGGVFLRFPRLKIVSAENEAGWVGHLLDRMDHLFGRERRRILHNTPIKDAGMLPSEYFRRNMAMTFIWDPSGVAVRNWIGVDNLMWSNDYPHDDSSWPNSKKVREELFRGVPTVERRKIEAENAARLYGFN